MTQVNLKDCIAHPVTYAQSLMDQLEAAEARAAQLEAALQNERAALSREDALSRQLQAAQARIAELEQRAPLVLIDISRVNDELSDEAQP